MRPGSPSPATYAIVILDIFLQQLYDSALALLSAFKHQLWSDIMVSCMEYGRRYGNQLRIHVASARQRSVKMS